MSVVQILVGTLAAGLLSAHADAATRFLSHRDVPETFPGLFHPDQQTPRGPAPKPQGPMLVAIPPDPGVACGTVLAFSDGCPGAGPCTLLRRSRDCAATFGPVEVGRGPTWCCQNC